METTIQMLNSNIESQKYNLAQIYYTLSLLLDYNKTAYSVAEEDLIEDHYFYELLGEQWGNNFISKNTIDLLNNFVDKWKKYKEKYSYSSDEVFVYLDRNWYHILSTYLYPALVSMENDLIKHEIEFNCFSRTRNNIYPNFEMILNRVSILYKKLKES